MIGTVGDVCLVREEPNFAIKNIGLFKTKGEINGKWLYYYMKSPYSKALIESQKRGTTQAYIPLVDLRRFPIKYPKDEDLVGAITSLLSSLDDKIELNRRMNQTLEAISRAIFRDWFIDFGPTRAKVEGRAPYLAPELWDLFPDTLDNENKPVGWKKQGLGEFVSLTKGGSYRSAELKDSDVALVTLKSFKRGGGYRHGGLKPYTGKYKPEQVVKPGELVVALTDVTQAADVIGKPAIVLEDDRYDTLVASLDVGIVRLRDDRVGRCFISQLLRTEQFQDHTYSYCTGTTVLHLSKDALPTFKASVPSRELAACFENTVEPITARVAANARETRSLARTRDLLLPKLMSGEILLREVENELEAVT